ncbi:MAG: anti-sigma factor, partial [Cytophagaceae bacterium]|nr:anti-sigma factor [Cytophagaceae bacterium]
EETSKQLSILMDTMTTKIVLKGMPVSPASKATAYWNKNSKDVMIAVANLPAPPSDKQYQLWALKDGKPIDAGVFEMNSDMQQMKNIEGAQAFAVTLEKKGGSPVPTLEALYLMGNI